MPDLGSTWPDQDQSLGADGRAVLYWVDGRPIRGRTGQRPAGEVVTSRFSDFICSLRSGDEPSQQSFDVFLSKLRPALLRQVFWRGLWDRPPRYLGVVGSSWTDPEAREELLADFCEFMVRRLPGLWRRCEEEPDIDYLVYLNIRNFVHQAQEKHDPVGSRIHRILKSAVKRAIDGKRLYLLASHLEIYEGARGDPEQELGRNAGEKIDYSSTLGFTPQTDPLNARGVDLEPRVELWRAELLPDLVTAYQYTGVVLKLEACIGSLRDQEVESFHFGDLMDCLRTQARAWLVTAQQASEGRSAPGDDDENQRLVPIVGPDTGIEGRDALYKLSRCVAAGIGQLEDRRTRDYLLKLWLCLHNWAAESVESEDRTDFAGLEGDRLPSAKKLSEILGIPRNRISDLKHTLGRLVRACQRSVSGKVPVSKRDDELPGRGLSVGSPSRARQEEGSIDMRRKNRLERLRVQMGEAAARFADDRARIESQRRWPPRLGDIFLLDEGGGAPVEWLAVEQDAEDLRRLLVVPADGNPFIGSRDVEVPAEAAAGLTSIRCDLGVWLDAGTLAPERRTGVLSLEHINRVRHKRRAIEAGSRAGSVLEQEVDQDPEYQEWRETIAAARAVLKDRSAVEVRGPSSARRTSAGSPAAVAASILLMVAVGLGGTVAMQRARIADLQQNLKRALLPTPQIDLPFHHFTGLEPVRGPDQPLVVAATAERIALIFEVAEPEPYPSYRLEMLESDTEREIWTDDRLTRTGSELSLDVPRSLFSSGSYVFRIYGLGKNAPALVEEYTLSVKIE